MSIPLHVLIVEDSDPDYELLVIQLRKGGYAPVAERVDTKPDMESALRKRPWDLVLSDWNMPTFSATAALATLRESGLDLPFIIISGSIGEETAVTALKSGAHDFLVKGRLTRLFPAIERELREARDRRQHRLTSEAAAEALRLRLEAEAASAAKSRFLAGMSHELRTPLNAIIGFSELMEDGQAGPLADRQKRYIQNISHSARHLLRLINEILDLSRVEAGRVTLNREAVSLEQIAADVSLTLGPLATKASVNLSMTVPPDLSLIDADPLRLKQILFNLLSNGIKFTLPGGAVRLEARNAGDKVEIVVRDNGCGISKEDLPKLFGEFVRFGSDHRPQVEGTGLGLALTKKLVELHDGSIAVVSEEGRGSAFTVVLPVHERKTSRGETIPPRARSDAPAQVARTRVLLVEDDELSRNLARDLFEFRNYEVREAGAVGEALELLRSWTPDIVVSDIGIPGGGGEQLLIEIRRDPKFGKIPVLAVTARAMAGDRERLLAAGFDGYVSKPIDTRTFVPIVEELLTRGAQSRATA